MNGPLIATIVVGLIAYFCAMSTVGRWLALSRESASVPCDDRLPEAHPAIAAASPDLERIAS